MGRAAKCRYYKDTWRKLPYTYNAQKTIQRHHPDLWRLQDVAVIHYVDAKPWDRDHPEHQQFKDIVELWWRLYDSQSQQGSSGSGAPATAAPAAAAVAAAPAAPAAELCCVAV